MKPFVRAGSSLESALHAASIVSTLLVASDFDGALAEFAVDPNDVRPAPGAMEALRGLARLPRTTVALASGRDLRTLRELSGLGSAEPIVLIGSHGAESTRQGIAAQTRLEPAQRARLDELTARAAELIDGHPRARLERKQAAVAIHTRGLDQAQADSALAEAEALATDLPDVRVLTGKSVVELSVSKADKGTAVSALADLSHADAVFYSGDDVTDEDAFRALRADKRNVTVKVGPGETAARYRVDDVPGLVQVIAELHRLRADAADAAG